jgi:hypothetical protein
MMFDLSLLECDAQCMRNIESVTIQLRDRLGSIDGHCIFDKTIAESFQFSVRSRGMDKVDSHFSDSAKQICNVFVELVEFRFVNNRQVVDSQNSRAGWRVFHHILVCHIGLLLRDHKITVWKERPIHSHMLLF